MADTSANEGAKGGELLYAGVTRAAIVGRPQKEYDAEAYPNQSLPVRLAPLVGVKISFVAAGAAAVHSVAIATDGRLFAWGRNEAAQLGLGDLMDRNAPTEVALPGGAKAVAAACGKFHTACMTSDGSVYTWGADNYGQLGRGAGGATKKAPEPREATPGKAGISGATAVACGAEFTLVLANGKVHACGMPQYGQLGNGTDGSFNKSDSSIKLAYEPHPRLSPVLGELATLTCRAIACGTNHSLAADSGGGLWSWGNGGYGRLGHNVQKDELLPRKIDFFKDRYALPTDTPATLAAGATMSFACGVAGQPFAWGKLKTSGDNEMYPKPNYDLSGWNLRSAACGSTITCVTADTQTVTWGHALHGELAFGPAKKSSANPKEVDALNGYTVLKVACGVAQTLYVVDTTNPEDARLLGEEFKVWEAPPDEDPSAVPAKGGKGGVGKAAGKVKGPKKGGVKKPKASKKKATK